MTEKRKYWIGGLAMILLGMTFIVAAAGKMMAGSTAFDLFAFPAFVPPVMSRTIYYSLPYIELVVGVLLVLGIAIKFAAVLSVLLIIGFATSNILLITQGVESCANCFGLAGRFTPTASLLLDGVMAVMVLFIFYCYRGCFFNTTPWAFEPVPDGREYKYV